MNKVILFDGLNKGVFAPSDIDGFIEIDNEHLIIIELKILSKKMPIGQQLTLTRIADAWSKAGKQSLVIKVGHVNYNPENEIILKDTIVEEVFKNGIKRNFFNKQISLLDALTNYFKNNKIKIK